MDLHRFLLDLAATLAASPDTDRAPYAEALRDEYGQHGLADQVEAHPGGDSLVAYLYATAARVRGLAPEEVDAINAAHDARN